MNIQWNTSNSRASVPQRNSTTCYSGILSSIAPLLFCLDKSYSSGAIALIRNLCSSVKITTRRLGAIAQRDFFRIMWTMETWVVVTLNGAINLIFAEASCCFMFFPCFCFKFSRNAEQGRHFSGYSLVGHSLGGLVARVVPVHIDLKPRHLVTTTHRGHHTWANLIRKLSLEKCEKSRNTWWLEGLPEFI